MAELKTIRKCYVCGRKEKDLSKKKCKCGNFLFMVMEHYEPKEKEEKDNAGER